MPAWSEEFQGSATAPVATVISVGASSIALLNANDRRLNFTLQSGGNVPVHLGYGATAVASQSPPILAASGVLAEPDWVGAVNACTATGTVPVFVLELDVLRP